MKKALRFLLIALAVPALWFAGLMAAIEISSHASDGGNADAAVVLGAAVWDSKPSPVFEERIKHGIVLYQSGRVRALIMTGGVGEGDRLAESEVARDYAVQRGVPEKDVRIEKKSSITFENLKEAKAIAQANGWNRLLIVSDPWHMMRALKQARDLGMDAHPCPTPSSAYRSLGPKLRMLWREAYYYTRYLFGKP